MTGFEPRTSGIGSDHSPNWATTTAQLQQTVYVNFDATFWAFKAETFLTSLSTLSSYLDIIKRDFLVVNLTNI